MFVYTGKGGTPADLGKCVVVTGKVGEHFDSTQIGYAKYTESTNPTEDCGDKPEPIKDAVPLDEETREANEHMLFQPSATYTVTNNYSLNQYGSVDLVEGNEPCTRRRPLLPRVRRPRLTRPAMPSASLPWMTALRWTTSTTRMARTPLSRT